MRKFILFLFIFYSGSYSAQRNPIDSLLKLVKNSKEDTTRLRLYLKLGEVCDTKDNLMYAVPALQLANKILEQNKNKLNKNIFAQKAAAFSLFSIYYRETGDTAKCYEYANKRLFLYLETKDTIKIFEAFLDFGAYFNDISNMPKALEYYEKGLGIARLKNDKKLISYCYFQMGQMCEDNSNFALAIENFKKAVATSEETNDATVISWGLRKIGGCYGQLHNVTKGLVYINRALAMYAKENDSIGLMRTYGEIADVYKINKGFENAIANYRRSLSIAENENEKSGIFRYINRIGNTYRDMENYDSAFTYSLRGLKIAEEMKNNDGIMYSNLSLAKICFKQKKYLQAKAYIDPLTEILKKTFRREVIEIEQLAAKVDSACGNYKEALSHYQQYIMWRDKFSSDELGKHALREKYKEQADKQKTEQEAKDAISYQEKRKQQIIITAVSIGLLLVLILAGVILRSLRLNQKKNKIISDQKHLVEEKNLEITDSINYAKRIQSSMLPPLEEIHAALPNSFVLFKPKDIVSGDFYWFHKSNDSVLIAAADCTGHGVPGAFMSMLNSDKLNEAIGTSTDVSKILQLVNIGLKKALRQSDKDDSTRDGMDIAICSLSPFGGSVALAAGKNSPFEGDVRQGRTGDVVLEYAGANRPLWIIRKGKKEIEETKATKTAIGGLTQDEQEFTKHTLELQKGDTVYIFTDGFADQFSPDDKKLMTKKFKETLYLIQDKTMEEQKAFLENFIENWKGNMEQTDDILVIGVRV